MHIFCNWHWPWMGWACCYSFTFGLCRFRLCPAISHRFVWDVTSFISLDAQKLALSHALQIETDSLSTGYSQSVPIYHPISLVHCAMSSSLRDVLCLLFATPLLSIANVAHLSLQYTSVTQNITASVGEEVQLTCSVTNGSPDVVRISLSEISN